MQCLHCQHDNRAGARFCEQCGSPLPEEKKDKAASYKKACIWYYQRYGITKGPFTKKELKKLHDAQLIFGKTPILQEGLDEWVNYESLTNTLALEEKKLKPAQPDGWYFFKDSSTMGPYTQDEFKNLISQGRITVNDLVCQPGSTQFIPFAQSSLSQAAPKADKDLNVWYYTVDDHPCKSSLEQMIQKINAGELQDNSLVWNPALPNWQPLKNSPLGKYLPVDVLGYEKQPQIQSGWYLANDGLKLGPFDDAAMAQAVQAQESLHGAQVFKTGWSGWKPLIKTRWLPESGQAEDGWYLLESESVSGPYSNHDLATWLDKDVLAANASCWKNGYAQWMGIDTLKHELARDQQAKPSAFQNWRNNVQAKNKARLDNTEEPVWYLGINQKSQGPYTASAVQKSFANGIIDKETLIWKKGLPDWIEYQDCQLYKTRPVEEQWFYVDNEQSKGPFTYKQMQEMYYQSIINDYTWVWRQGLADWQAYKDSQLAY